MEPCYLSFKVCVQMDTSLCRIMILNIHSSNSCCYGDGYQRLLVFYVPHMIYHLLCMIKITSRCLIYCSDCGLPSIITMYIVVCCASVNTIIQQIYEPLQQKGHSLEPGSPLAREKLFPCVGPRERAWKILITCWTWLPISGQFRPHGYYTWLAKT